MVIIGQSESRKTDIVEGIINGEIPALAMQWDYRTAFSSTQNDKLQTRPYKDLGEITETFPTLKPKHALVVMDDPPPHRHDAF